MLGTWSAQQTRAIMSINLIFLFTWNHRDVSTQAEEIKPMRGVFAENRETRRGSWASPELITNDFSHLRLAVFNCQCARLFLYSVLLSPLSSVVIPSNKNRKNLRFLLNQPHPLVFCPWLIHSSFLWGDLYSISRDTTCLGFPPLSLWFLAKSN